MVLGRRKLNDTVNWLAPVAQYQKIGRQTAESLGFARALSWAGRAIGWVVLGSTVPIGKILVPIVYVAIRIVIALVKLLLVLHVQSIEEFLESKVGKIASPLE